MGSDDSEKWSSAIIKCDPEVFGRHAPFGKDMES